MLALFSVNDDAEADGLWLERGIRVSSDSRKIAAGSFPRCLPLRPVWPGFAINTLFYAAILWGVWMLLGALANLQQRNRASGGGDASQASSS